MVEYFEKLYNWDEFIECNNYDKMCYIGNLSIEPRTDNESKIKELERSCSCKTILVEYDYEKDSFVYDNKLYNLQFQTSKLFEDLDKTIPLVINITSLNLRLLGAFLFHIKKMRFEKVYCIYTEPLKYCKNKAENEETKYIDRFDLYKKFRGIQAIPGYLRGNIQKLNERWVAFLGFEGKRLEQINEKYEFDNIVPVITLPSYQPGWHNYVIDENIDLIKQAERKPDYIIANSFMSSYNYLSNMLENTDDVYIRVSPLGTKINALGALLFSLNNKNNIEILYDNPIAEGKISEGVGKTYVFDISEVINQVDN